jgi:hypothetical protein
MNKLSMLALTGLILCGVNNVFSMGQEQREILYTLHALEQNFVDVPMIFQNLDMFMGVLEMNIQITEIKLKDANQKIKSALLKSGALLGGAVVGQFIFGVGLEAMKAFAVDSGYNSLSLRSIIAILIQGCIACRSAVHIYVGLDIYNVLKNRAALMEMLALDKEILSKLQEIKDSMAFIDDNADSAGNILLKRAE